MKAISSPGVRSPWYHPEDIEFDLVIHYTYELKNFISYPTVYLKVDQAWDSQNSKYIGRTDTIMDKEKEVNSNQESSNKSQAVVEWLLGELIPNCTIFSEKRPSGIILLNVSLIQR